MLYQIINNFYYFIIALKFNKIKLLNCKNALFFSKRKRQNIKAFLYSIKTKLQIIKAKWQFSKIITDKYLKYNDFLKVFFTLVVISNY